MAMIVIEGFEVVDIETHKAMAGAPPFACVDFPAQGFDKISPVEKASQWITD